MGATLWPRRRDCLDDVVLTGRVNKREIVMSQSNHERITTIVIGGLNTDIIANGVPRLLGQGELALGGTLEIGPGGKSRNIAQMMATLQNPGLVAMIGKTTHDPWGLWRYPVDALIQAGVDVSQITIMPFEVGRMPGVALIPVDGQGNNQIYVLPGVNADFGPEDIDLTESLFAIAQRNHGAVVLSLECPLKTVIHSLQKAKQHQLVTMLDPGGISTGQNYQEMLGQGLFLIKPNSHEAELLTGHQIDGLASARRAAQFFFQHGIEIVFITAGNHGAYLFALEQSIECHVPIPKISLPGQALDETGCGDQTMAALAVAIQSGKSIQQAARIAVTAGTLQFHRVGIIPLTRAELNVHLEPDLQLDA